MDFFNRFFLDNPIKNYVIIALIIAVFFIFKRHFSRTIASIGYRLLSRVWKHLDRMQFIGLIVEPIEWFLLIVITVFSLDKLTFPPELDFSIYGFTLHDILSRIGKGIIVASFIGLVLRLIDFIASVLKQQMPHGAETKENQLIVFFRDFLKVLVALIGILFIIKVCFNQPIGQLLTGLSIVGAALALAAKESLENLIASFIIFFDKPFFTDDFVKVNSITGNVDRIGLRSTRIRTADKTLVTVPNKQMVDSIVDNYSMRTKRRGEIILELSHKTSLNVVQDFLDEIKKLLSQENLPVQSPTVLFKRISKNGLQVYIEFFTEPIDINEFDNLNQELNFCIIKMMEEKKIELEEGI